MRCIIDGRLICIGCGVCKPLRKLIGDMDKHYEIPTSPASPTLTIRP